IPRAFSSGAASIWSYALNSPPKRSAPIFVSAAVSAVLPCATRPIVPTFTWGLVRSNLPFAMAASRCWVGGELPGKHDADECGAHEWNRTIDLLLTKEVLYRLSYVSGNFSTAVERFAGGTSGSMEREKGIEPS